MGLSHQLHEHKTALTHDVACKIQTNLNDNLRPVTSFAGAGSGVRVERFGSLILQLTRYPTSSCRSPDANLSRLRMRQSRGRLTPSLAGFPCVGHEGVGLRAPEFAGPTTAWVRYSEPRAICQVDTSLTSLSTNPSSPELESAELRFNSVQMQLMGMSLRVLRVVRWIVGFVALCRQGQGCGSWGLRALASWAAGLLEALEKSVVQGCRRKIKCQSKILTVAS